jgi:MarR family transcriptional regulator, organic hydroperoxide resistance regulator
MNGPTPGYLVWRLSMKWRVALDRALAPLGLTHAQYSVLASLVGLPESPNQRQLADHTGLEPLYVSKLARTLEAAGLIHRAGDPADTRAVRLSLTGPGRQVASEAIAIVRHLQSVFLAPLGGPESRRGAVFIRELTALLAVPLEPDVKE